MEQENRRDTSTSQPADTPLVVDKQKLLLSTDAGHFSLVRALHLADLITELNGEHAAALPNTGKGPKKKIN